MADAIAEMLRPYIQPGAGIMMDGRTYQTIWSVMSCNNELILEIAKEKSHPCSFVRCEGHSTLQVRLPPRPRQPQQPAVLAPTPEHVAAQEAVGVFEQFAAAIASVEPDFAIIVARDGQRLPTHQFVLTARSPVFKRMLETDMQEKRTSECKIDGYSAVSLLAFLQVLHGKPDSVTPAVLGDLVELFGVYQVGSVVDAVGSTRFARLIEVANAAEVFFQAARHNQTAALQLAADFICKNKSAVKATDSWKERVKGGLILDEASVGVLI